MLDILPNYIVEMILRIPIDLYNEDEMFWLNSPNNGKFNTKFTWNLIHGQFDDSQVFKNIWSSGIPTSCSVLCWKILHQFIPVDSQLKLKGFYLPSKCLCYFHEENLEHVFLNGPIASGVWIWFEELCNILVFHGSLSLEDLLHCLFLGKPKNHIGIVIPLLIL